MPEPISSPSVKRSAVQSAQGLGQLLPHLALAGGAEVDAPLGVVFVGRRVVVAGVYVLDVVGRGSGRGGIGREQYMARRNDIWRGPNRFQLAREYVQENQPPGVPPLPLTGERTLPDVPEENYWFRRHLAVYEWIAARVAGKRVVDMACGEGYGSDVLAASAASVVGVDANPEAHEHARLRYVRANLRYERDLVESFAEPCDAVVFLQTIEHVQDAGAILEHFKSMLAPGGAVYVSTPNLLTLAPPGAEKSDNPWHVREYRAAEFRALCEAHFERVEMLGLFHARKLRAHEIAIGLGLGPRPQGTAADQALLRSLHPGDRAADFRLDESDLDRRWTSSPSAMAEESVGDLAIVLHSHMPYVEGFGTYPFGEEWLFDAVIRSYLPVLEVARDLTMTVTPVLADQLEDRGAASGCGSS